MSLDSRRRPPPTGGGRPRNGNYNSHGPLSGGSRRFKCRVTLQLQKIRTLLHNRHQQTRSPPPPFTWGRGDTRCRASVDKIAVADTFNCCCRGEFSCLLFHFRVRRRSLRQASSLRLACACCRRSRSLRARSGSPQLNLLLFSLLNSVET